MFFSLRIVSPLLNETSDLIVSFTGLFLFVILRLRHSISSLWSFQWLLLHLHCRLCHFLLLCGGCNFGFVLDFSFEFGIALFFLFCFNRSHFRVTLALCVPCCFHLLLVAVCFSLDFFLRCCDDRLICFSVPLGVLCVECCEVLHHQPLLHPLSSLAHLFECVRSNTDTFNSIPWSQFGIEISSHNFHVLSFGFSCVSQLICKSCQRDGLHTPSGRNKHSSSEFVVC